jgi:ferrous iron transport protein B
LHRLKVNIHSVALIGNPNTGKTSLFNQLTGSHQHVGNWPGVTVERKEGLLQHNDITVKIVDLPGMYSINKLSDTSASPPDERLAVSYLVNESPDVVLALLDASHVERSLYLTVQLLELGLPVVIALNMIDIARGRGLIIDVEKLAEELGAPIVQIVAREGIGLDKLKDELLKCAAQKTEESRKSSLVTFETDEFETIEKRWNFVGELVARVVTLDPSYREVRNFSDILDRIVTNRFLGLPILALIMWFMFKLTYTIGDPAADFVRKFWRSAGAWTADFLASLGAPYLFNSFIEEALFGGVGAVVVFFPHIFILFAFIALLEDCGYMARGAFVMDRVMHLLGLHGKSFIPMLLGFGCNVPSIIASRILTRTRDKMLTLLIIPFMSCSARLPVFVLFATTFFGENAPTVIFSLYLTGIAIAVCSAKIFGRLFFSTSSSHLMMELPPYLLPQIKTVFYHAWERSFDFIKRAGTFILVSMILIWGLASLPAGVEYANQDSFAGRLGSFIAPVFSPAGFGFWQASVSLLFGFFSKEIVIGTLGTLLGNTDFHTTLRTLFSPASAYAFMVMTLLYVPCVATLAAFYKETYNWRWTLFLAAYTTAIAWVCAVFVFQAAKFMGFA